MKLNEIIDGKRKEKQFSCIYLWTNLQNGKHYVGQTQHFYDRMTQYANGGANKYLHNAIEKYGLDEFDISIIEKVPIDTLDEREQYWIDYYESYKSDKGYNICQYASTTRGYKHTEESRKKMSENISKFYQENPDKKLTGEANGMFGKEHTEEWRKEHSDWLKNKWANDEDYRKFWHEKMSGENNYFYGKHFNGELNPMYGKHHSEETRKKISEALTGKDYGTGFRIICIETGIEYPSMSRCAKEIGAFANAVKIAVDNPKRTCKGFHFKKVSI